MQEVIWVKRYITHSNMPTDKQTSIQTNMQTVLPFSTVCIFNTGLRRTFNAPDEHFWFWEKAAENLFETRKYHKKKTIWHDMSVFSVGFALCLSKIWRTELWSLLVWLYLNPFFSNRQDLCFVQYLISLTLLWISFSFSSLVFFTFLPLFIPSILYALSSIQARFNQILYFLFCIIINYQSFFFFFSVSNLLILISRNPTRKTEVRPSYSIVHMCSSYNRAARIHHCLGKTSYL